MLDSSIDLSSVKDGLDVNEVGRAEVEIAVLVAGCTVEMEVGRNEAYGLDFGLC